MWTVSPHLEGNGGVMVSGYRGFFGYLGSSNYRLGGEDQTIWATGLDVLDFSIRQRIRRWVDYYHANIFAEASIRPQTDFLIDKSTNAAYDWYRDGRHVCTY